MNDDGGAQAKKLIAKARDEAQSTIEKLQKAATEKITGAKRRKRDKERNFDPDLAKKLAEKSKMRSREIAENHRQDILRKKEEKRRQLRAETLSSHDDRIIEKLYERCITDAKLATGHGERQAFTLMYDFIPSNETLGEKVQRLNKWYRLGDHACLRLYDRHNFEAETDGKRIIITLYE